MAKQTAPTEPVEKATTEPAEKAPTKPYRVVHNILGKHVDPEGAKVARSRPPFKLYRPGSTIYLDETDAAQQIAIGHIKPIK